MKKIKLQLFGSFLLQDGDSVLGEDMLHSRKLMRLLVYILVNRDSVLTHQKLIEVFWEDDSRSPGSALKNLMYRLRNILRVLGNEQYICTLPGAYCWNSSIEVEIDYEYFEKLTMSLRGVDPEDREEGKKLCREIIDCYRGNITGTIAEEPWILPKVTWYRSLYMDTLKTLCEIYEEENNWYDLEMVCNQALTLDSLDEDIHCFLMRALVGQKKYDLAISHYEKVKKLFYENLGIRHLDRLHKVFCEMMSETGEYTADLSSILKELREQKKPEGAFFCDYQIFRLIYQMEARRVERLGVAEYVILLTVRRMGSFSRNVSTDEIVMAGVEKLEAIIREMLRTGDLAARYSPAQFILLLPACSYEASVSVAARIRESFRKSIGLRRLELICVMEELSTYD